MLLQQSLQDIIFIGNLKNYNLALIPIPMDKTYEKIKWTH